VGCPLDTTDADAQWFSRDLIKSLHADSAKAFSKQDYKQIDAEQAAALAPANATGDNVVSGVGLTRVPPTTAIAGQLVALWAQGDLDLVSKL
jgi:NAD+ diphosphatase